MWGGSALPLLGLLAASAAAQEPTPRPTADARAIARLIQQLGDGRYAVREEATRKLAEIGAAAVPALRQAARSDDPEIRIRARRLLQTVEHPTPEQLAQRRRSIREAFQAGDYPRMIRLGMRLTAAKSASLLDWLWLGHGCQLAGRWRAAVDAYQKVVRLMPDPASNVAGEILPPPDAKGIIGPHSGPVNGPLQRTVLSLWIARIQTAKLHDVKAAAAQLTEALGFFEKAGLKGEHLRRQLLTELAAAQHSAGDLRGAFRTWAQLPAPPGAVG